MLGLNGKGTSIRFVRRVATGMNPFGEPITTEEYIDIDNVLVSPGKTTELNDTNRPEGVVVAYTLHIPKDAVRDLTGCLAYVPNGFGGIDQCEVIGSPRPTMQELTPGDWCMQVEVKLVDG